MIGKHIPEALTFISYPNIHVSSFVSYVGMYMMYCVVKLKGMYIVVKHTMTAMMYVCPVVLWLEEIHCFMGRYILVGVLNKV